MAKIGVGIITCNRNDFLKGLLASLPREQIDELVVVNDGKAENQIEVPGIWLQNEVNLGVGKSKNKAMKHLYDAGCDYIFIIEDDMIIKDKTVFAKYIEAYKQSGIEHFNYGPGSPFNRKQTIKDFDLHNRHLLDQHSEPNPKLIIEYPNNVKIALYEHTVAMFSFFTRNVIEKVGYIDEEFYNAWEHVDHTYRIIKAGFHPPFWWFADIANSTDYLTEAPGAIDNSSIANKTEQWQKNVYDGREIYLKKHGHYPNQPLFVTKDDVINTIKKLKPVKKSYSQYGQDLFVIDTLNGKKNGYFVEIGSTDGVDINNTLLLEQDYNWKGICIEPNKTFFSDLIKNRKSICLNDVIDSTEKTVLFKNHQTWSQITDKATKDTETRQTKVLNKILVENKAPNEIDYLSIDCEGNELTILKSLNFNKYSIKIITVEHNAKYHGPAYKNEIRSFLESKNFKYVKTNKANPKNEHWVDDIEDFYINNNLT